MRSWLGAMVLAIFLVGCGDDSSPSDTGTDVGATICTNSADCDDGLFCTGVGTCDPDNPASGSGGCVFSGAPCLPGTTCSEAEARCVNGDCSNADVDGDGVDAVECGGSDCDDGDPSRYPGNTEVCDPADHDEDCDPRTFGIRDLDGDGEADALCCNGTNCGTDCDDTRATVSPVATEACNDRDDDCDGTIDEGVLATFTEDGDGDGHGSDVAAASTMLACAGAAISGFAEGPADDCDDSANDVNPGLGESCDDSGRDEDCDGTVDEDCDCTFPSNRPCGLPGVCSMGVEACDAMTGRFGMCSIEPTPGETSCDGFDEDCDGSVDEGTTIDCYQDEDDDGYPVDAAMRIPSCPDLARPFVAGCPPNTTNRVPTASNSDCNDLDPNVHPGAPEICDLVIDHDCDGMVDEAVTVTCYADNDNDTYSPLSSPATAQCPQGGRVSVGGCPTNWTNRLATPLVQDCNDTPPGGSTINPVALEICDAAMVDENCNGVGNEDCMCDAGSPDIGCDEPGRCMAGTRTCNVAMGTYGMCSISGIMEICNGEDDDCNGAIDNGFECVQGSDPVGCATTCTTPGTQTCTVGCALNDCVAPEACNACDDDGDGMDDEDFACVRDQAGSTCTTMCGTIGTGTCNSSCSGVLNCSAAEICNFCDDDGNVATTDQVLATGTVSSRAACATLDRYSGATCSSGLPDVVTLIEGTVGSDRGAAYYNPAAGLFLGWGPLEQHIQIHARRGTTTFPADGWALVLADGGTGFVGGVGGSLAIPETRQGIAIEWHFFTGFSTSAETDCLRVSRLDGDGTKSALHSGSCAAIPPPSMHLDASDSGTIVQDIFIRYTPDDASVSGNEEELLEIYFNDDGSGSPAFQINGVPSPPPFCSPGPCFNLSRDLTVGAPLTLGVTASSGGARSTIEWITGMGAGGQVSTLTRENVCF